MVSFETDIKPIFAPYNCMKDQTVATDGGAYLADLTDYETVKKIHKEILFSIDDAWEDGQKVSYQAMPPGGQLPQADIDLYKQWIKGDMQP